MHQRKTVRSWETDGRALVCFRSRNLNGFSIDLLIVVVVVIIVVVVVVIFVLIRWVEFAPVDLFVGFPLVVGFPQEIGQLVGSHFGHDHSYRQKGRVSSGARTKAGKERDASWEGRVCLGFRFEHSTVSRRIGTGRIQVLSHRHE